MTPTNAFLNELAHEVVAQYGKYKAAKARFVRTTARMADVTAPQPQQAANAFDRQQAITDCRWYQDDIKTLAAVWDVVYRSQMGEPQ